MKYRILLISLLLINVSFVLAQRKSYSRVYIETKNGGEWSGTQKTTYSATLENIDKGAYAIGLKVSEKESMVIYVKFEAMTSDNKAFHSIVKGHYGESNWTSPSGSKQITWVYINKNIETIESSDPKPFDFEIQFGDGSAVKYYVSP